MQRIEKLKSFLIENPNDSFVQHALALEYIKTGDDEQAKKLFENILANDPGYTGSYYHLAKLFERTGENEKAVACYKTGMKAAKQAGDQHAFNELKSAYEEFIF